MNLWDLKPGKKTIIKKILPSDFVSFGKRLEELGFVTGEAVECIRRTPFGGPRVYRIGGTVFSLAADIANIVEIELESEV